MIMMLYPYWVGTLILQDIRTVEMAPDCLIPNLFIVVCDTILTFKC